MWLVQISLESLTSFLFTSTLKSCNNVTWCGNIFCAVQVPCGPFLEPMALSPRIFLNLLIVWYFLLLLFNVLSPLELIYSLLYHWTGHSNFLFSSISLFICCFPFSEIYSNIFKSFYQVLEFFAVMFSISMMFFVFWVLHLCILILFLACLYLLPA